LGGGPAAGSSARRGGRKKKEVETPTCVTAKAGRKIIKAYVAAYVILNIFAMMYVVAMAPTLPQHTREVLLGHGGVANVTTVVKWSVDYLLSFYIGNAYLISALISGLTGVALYVGLRTFSRVSQDLSGHGIGWPTLALLIAYVGGAAAYVALALWAKAEVPHAYAVASAAAGVSGSAGGTALAEALERARVAVLSLQVVRVSYATAGFVEFIKGLCAAICYYSLWRVMKAPYSRAIAALFMVQGTYTLLRRLLMVAQNPYLVFVDEASGFIIILVAGRLLLQWGNASAIARIACKVTAALSKHSRVR